MENPFVRKRKVAFPCQVQSNWATESPTPTFAGPAEGLAPVAALRRGAAAAPRPRVAHRLGRRGPSAATGAGAARGVARGRVARRKRRGAGLVAKASVKR